MVRNLNSSFYFLDLAVTQATKNILNCRNRYPEIEPYLISWINRVRRSNIECLNTSSLGTYEAAHNNGGVIYFPKDRLSKVILGNKKMWDTLVVTFTHEIFHSPPANNFKYLVHNKSHAWNDRVNLLAEMCNNKSGRLNRLYQIMVSEGNLNSCVDIFIKSKNRYRMKERNKLNWSSASRLVYIMKSASLKKESAIKLCKQILDEGPYYFSGNVDN